MPKFCGHFDGAGYPPQEVTNRAMLMLDVSDGQAALVCASSSSTLSMCYL